MQVGYEKIAIFDHYLALSRKLYKIVSRIRSIVSSELE